jgi:hypothetical protein
MTLNIESKYSLGLLNCVNIYEKFASSLDSDFSGAIIVTKQIVNRDGLKQDVRIVITTANQAGFRSEWKFLLKQYLEEFFILQVGVIALEIPEKIQRNDALIKKLRNHLQKLNMQSPDHFFRLRVHSNLQLALDGIGTKRALFNSLPGLNETFNDLVNQRDTTQPKMAARHSLAPGGGRGGVGSLPSLMSLMSSSSKEFVYQIDEKSLLYKVMTNLRENGKDFKACLKEKFGDDANFIQNQKNLEIRFRSSNLTETEKDWLAKVKRFVVEYENRKLARLEIDLRPEFADFDESDVKTVLSEFAYFVAIKYQDATKLSITSRVFLYDFLNDDTLLVMYGCAEKIEEFRDEIITPELDRIKSLQSIASNETKSSAQREIQVVKFSYKQFFKEYNILYNFQSKRFSLGCP